MNDGLGILPLAFAVTALIAMPFYGNWSIYWAAIGLTLLLIFARRGGPNVKRAALLSLAFMGLLLYGIWPEVHRVSAFLSGTLGPQSTLGTLRLFFDGLLLLTGLGALFGFAQVFMRPTEEQGPNETSL